MGFPNVRLRRLRQTTGIRRLCESSMPGPEKFLWPVFVFEGSNRAEPIDAMPGQQRLTADRLVRELESVASAGVGGILVFGLVEPSKKDDAGSAALAEQGVVQRAVTEVRRAFPDLPVFTDVCLCAYSKHGHCGPLTKEGNVDNDAANAMLARIAVSHAAAGANGVAPSAMMDGQVAAIRRALDDGGFVDTIIMSYSTKFASAMYGPFRDAEQSAPQHGDRRGYQASYSDPRAALRESKLDEAEGADILMVKPALFYLDVLARLRARTDLPIAAYNVSGEYSMLIAAADRGFGNLAAMVRESTFAMARAGADIIISYWANRYLEIFAP